MAEQSPAATQQSVVTDTYSVTAATLTDELVRAGHTQF